MRFDLSRGKSNARRISTSPARTISSRPPPPLPLAVSIGLKSTAYGFGLWPDSTTLSISRRSVLTLVEISTLSIEGHRFQPAPPPSASSTPARQIPYRRPRAGLITLLLHLRAFRPTLQMSAWLLDRYARANLTDSRE